MLYSGILIHPLGFLQPVALTTALTKFTFQSNADNATSKNRNDNLLTATALKMIGTIILA